MTPGEPVTPRRPTTLARVGRWLLVAAALVVAFVAYQQWGTALAHWQGQRDLRSRFDQALSRSRSEHRAGNPPPPAYPGVGDPVGIIVIPRIGLDQVIVEGVGADQLAVGPGHYPGTPLPGQPGNAAIAGHRTTHGAPFNGLAELQRGDPIEITTLQGHFTYLVTGSEVVSPDDGAVLDATTTSQLTLTTCTPKYSAAQRLIVVARLVTPAAPATPIPAADRSATVAGADPVDSPGTWLVLVGASLALAGLYAAVRAVRRRPSRPHRPAGRDRLARLAPWLAVPVGLVLLYVAFAALDTLLPASF